jgi:predicted ThiF/HesA family dinucleotide-utilizing enzyme
MKRFIIAALCLTMFFTTSCELVHAADGFVQMPSDLANTGKKSATVIKTDGPDTVHVSRSVIEDATSLNKMSVSAAGAAKVDGSGVTQPVSGTVDVTNFDVPASTLAKYIQLPTSIGARTTANSLAVNIASDQTVPVSGAFYQATQPVSLASVPTHGVTGTFWQATQPVSGTFWQATQPVSIASMPSTPVTGAFYQATQPVSGTFWQATQPVSLASAPTTPVTGTFWQATQPVSTPNLTQTISITTSTGTQSLAMNGQSSCGLQVFSVGTGGVLVFEGSGDNTNWAAMVGITNPTGVFTSGTSAPGAWQFDCTSVPYFRVRATALTSGTITGIIIGAANSSIVQMESPVQIGNSQKATYVLYGSNQNNTSLGQSIAIEAGATKTVRIRKIVINQVGTQTTAGFRTLTIKRTTTAGSAGVTVPAPVDPADGAFSGIGRVKGTDGTAGTVLYTFPFWVPTAGANQTPILVWPSGNAATELDKDLTIAPGVTNGITVNDSGATGGALFVIQIIFTEE